MTNSDSNAHVNPDDRAEADAETSTDAGTSSEATARARTPDDIQYDLIAALKTVYDPEIPVDIYELGLIYEADVNEHGEVSIVMTLTSPMCPVAETLPPEVEAKAREVEGVTDVNLDLVWDPPWDMDMMSTAARLELNM